MKKPAKRPVFFEIANLIHWAEIEGPERLSYTMEPSENDIRIMKASEERIKKAMAEILPPKPDPFEQWWARINGDVETRGWVNHAIAKAGWDAAMKYKEGK